MTFQPETDKKQHEGLAHELFWQDKCIRINGPLHIIYPDIWPTVGVTDFLINAIDI